MSDKDDDLQVVHIPASPMTPNAASLVQFGRFLRVLIMTRYALAFVSNKAEVPKRPGTCWDAIVMAEPVMKPATAGVGMNSTSQPSRSRPIASTMKPHMKDSVTAIWTLLHLVPYAAWTLPITVATSRHITATGPIDTSFEVAKN